jgi:hypothetical protein
VRLEEARLDRGVEIFARGAAELYPEGESTTPIRFPLHLRLPPGDATGANRLALHLPIHLPHGLRPLESGVLRLGLELQGGLAVAYEATFQWWTRQGTLQLGTLRRTQPPWPLHLKLAALSFLLVALLTWNQVFNQGVHENGQLLSWFTSSRNIDRALFFLTGLFGLHLVGAAWSSIRSWVSFWRLPELYLHRDFALFLRSRMGTYSLLGAGLISAAGFASFHSLPLHREGLPNRASWWLNGQQVEADRVLVRDVPDLVLRCDSAGEHPFADAVVAPDGRAIVPEYRPYLATIDALDVPAGCGERADGERTVTLRFTAADDLDDRCIQPFRREIRALFCGYPVEGRFQVAWAGESRLTVEPTGELGAGELDRLIEDHWLPRLGTGPASARGEASDLALTAEIEPAPPLPLPNPQELVEASRQLLGGQRVSWRVFEELYETRIAKFRKRGPDEAVREMLVLHAGFELYRAAPSKEVEIPLSFVDRVQRDFLALYDKKPRQKPWLAAVDKQKLAAYLGFVLSFERELGDRPEAKRLAAAVQRIIEREGYEFYMLYLRASVSVAKSYGGSFFTQASQARYGFLLERLTAVNDKALDLRRELRALAELLDEETGLYQEEVQLIGRLLARAPLLVA